MIDNPLCPLCSHENTNHFHKDDFREYLTCSVCDLAFAHPDSWLSRDEEFKRYELHENNLEDPGYRNFLTKMCEPMLQRIQPKSKGLDFGSGPGPLLKLMFEEQGHEISIYDTFYAPDTSVFNTSYDFITTTEAAEHLHNPLEELDRLWTSLKAGGFLGIMTSLRMPPLNFTTWHYIKDETHVIFFSPKTMKWLADHWNAKLEIISDSVVIFEKHSYTRPSADSNPRLAGKTT